MLGLCYLMSEDFIFYFQKWMKIYCIFYTMTIKIIILWDAT